jgi:hypothetical protein
MFLATATTSAVFAADAVGIGDDSDEPVFAQETDGNTYDFSSDEDALTLKEIEESVYDIDETETPLVEFPSVENWALVNVLAALAAIILSASTVTALIAERAAKAKILGVYGSRKEFVLRYSPIFKLLGAGLGFVSAIIFLLTEDIHGVMQPIDEFTWLMALILIVQSIVLFTAFGGEKRFRGIGGM